MTTLPIPLIAPSIVLLLVTAYALDRVASDARARAVAIAVSALVFAAMLGIAIAVALGVTGTTLVDSIVLGEGAERRGIFGADALSAPLLALVSAITTTLLVARPRGELDRHRVRSVLVTLALILGVFAARDLAVLTCFFVLSVVPLWLEARRRGDRVLVRTLLFFTVAGSLLLVTAVVLVGISTSRTGTAHPLHLADIAALGVAPELATPISILLGLAVMLRGGVFPFHGFLITLFDRAPLGVALLLWAGQPARYLVARVLLEVLPTAGVIGVNLLVELGLVTALLAAFVALAQHDLKRLLGALATSQSGLLLIGLAAGNVEALVGGLTYWISCGLAVSGLAIVIAMVEARVGTTDMRLLGGLSVPAPVLSTLFLALSVAAVGLPGTLAFVGDDLLVHGMLETLPFVAGAQLAASLLNAITLFRAYTLVFLGTPRTDRARLPRGRDLSTRERLAIALFVVALVGFGLFPGALVEERVLAAEITRDLGHEDGSR
jgi:NADH-quinone oxidoreductase subunit M